MKFPKTRDTKAISEEKGHAVYSNWKKSLIDYKLWQQMHIEKGKDLTDYYAFLKTVKYAEDPFYIRKLQLININRYLL